LEFSFREIKYSLRFNIFLQKQFFEIFLGEISTFLKTIQFGSVEACQGKWGVTNYKEDKFKEVPSRRSSQSSQ
jgi:hypothetical protein